MSNDFVWRTKRSCVFKNFVHVVFVTKYRQNVFTNEILDRLKQIFLETCKQMGNQLIQFGGEDDHVHLLISCPPRLALANFVSKLKGKSSYLLRREFWPIIKTKLWGKRFWSPSYCIVSCGATSLEIIKQYVKEQKKAPLKKHIDQSRRFTGRKRNSQKKWLA